MSITGCTHVVFVVLRGQKNKEDFASKLKEWKLQLEKIMPIHNLVWYAIDIHIIIFVVNLISSYLDHSHNYYRI